jgi:hypothetical protein
MVQQMPKRTRAELEAECLHRLKSDVLTRDVVRVVLIKLPSSRQRAKLDDHRDGATAVRNRLGPRKRDRH